MMKAPRKLRIPTDTAELIRSLHPELKRKVRAALEQIVADPHCGKALKDELQGLRSYRVGKFRIIYRVGKSRTLDIVALGPRPRIYEETYRKLTKREAPGVRS